MDITNTILNSCPLITEENFSNVTNMKIEMEESNEDSYRNATRALIKNIIIPNEYTNCRNNSIPRRLETNKLRTTEALRISRSDIDVRNSVVLNEYLPILKSTNVTTQLIKTIYREKTREKSKKKKSKFETAGPSRVDCELLHRDLQNSWQPIINCPEPLPTNILENIEENINTQCELPNLTVKEEVIETAENVLDLNESTPQFEVNRNIEKRSGSPFEKIQIKREKLDDEDFSDNQIYIKNELPNLTVKEEVIETVENVLDLNESTPKFEVNSDIGRRSSSPFKDIEMKREKLDNEDFLDNQIYVKNEIHEVVDDCSFPNTNDIKEEIVTSNNMNNNKIHPHYCLSSLKICCLCDVYIEDIKDHVDKKHRNGIFFSCPFCESDTRYSIRKYSYESKKHKKHCSCYCEFCDQKFPNWLETSEHTSDVHNNQVNKQCTMCSYEAPFYSNLLVHILCCHNGQTLIDNCQYCDFATLNPALMQMHVAAKHQIVQEPSAQTDQPFRSYVKKVMVKCPICDCHLSSKRYLKKHMSFMHSKRDVST
ncbi:zinc finger protein 711-like [Coccinella septempunctata]|uniref:zinc finger protein 711-like n=1 Tax=Coccinella septempunctata TaxID=41139 RepID=UPI001D072C66|nr:zinc finger protein 711-like [Coccinella septempunctata]